MDFPDIDPRLSTWPFMESAVPITLIIIFYLLFVKVLGPAYMQSRQPYELRTLMILYNFAMVGFNSWLFYEFGIHGWFGRYHWLCEPLNFSTDESSMGMVTVCWYFLMSKLIELLDTVFFILRKKDKQVTFLHVVHHTIVPILVRYIIGHGAGGYNTMLALFNSFVHIWMYLYYGLSAVGPCMRQFIWWKKYLTSLQMIQFTVMAFLLVSNFVLCGKTVNTVLILVNIFPPLLFFVLFLDFYKVAYTKRAEDGTTKGTTMIHPRLRNRH